jgi:hypothetical protein
VERRGAVQRFTAVIEGKEKKTNFGNKVKYLVG